MSGILVVAPSWIGDAILSQPMLALLRRQDPASRIDVLAPAWALPIYRRMPEVAQTLESPFAMGNWLWAPVSGWRAHCGIAATKKPMLGNPMKSSFLTVQRMYLGKRSSMVCLAFFQEVSV